jgi:hypothetical protein
LIIEDIGTMLTSASLGFFYFYGMLFTAILSFIPLFIIGWHVWKIVVYYNRTITFVRISARVVNTSVVEEGNFSRTQKFRPYIYFYSPIIEFTTKNGEKHVLKSTERNYDRPLYKIAEEITICYNPNEPRKFFIYDPKTEYITSATWILIGLGSIYLMFFFNWHS